MADVASERVLARYRLGALLGRGAAGAVYQVDPVDGGDAVAIKIVEHVAPAPSAGARRRRLRRYFERMQAVSHPGIVTVHEAGRIGAHDYIVMELVRGGDLASFLSPGRLLPVEAALDVGMQVAFAIAHAHAGGMLHGDLKPANVLYEARTGRCKVVDFGMAGCDGAAHAPGTPLYMAPERLCGDPAVPASDQFSLAVLIYRLVAGAHPYQGRTRPEMLWSMAHGLPRPLRTCDPRARESLDTLLARALAKNPAERFADMADMAWALAALLERLRSAAPTGSHLTGALPHRPLPDERVASKHSVPPAPANALMRPAGHVAVNAA
jgi:eukaryotic-like serine/threonine-protein kinase